jgi:hypothetical protein
MFLWIIITLFFLNIGASIYNGYWRSRAYKMLRWLNNQRKIIENHEDYTEDKDRLEQSIIPTVVRWVDHSYYYIFLVTITQLVNLASVLAEQLIGQSYILNIGAAVLNPLVILIAFAFRKRLYITEGYCRGIQIITNAIYIQGEKEGT